MSDIYSKITTIQRLKDIGQIKQYIKYIRYPLYKQLDFDTIITFDFPLTVFVGKNGTGKSSALQSLAGAPWGTSLSNFWFSTSLDVIHETIENRRPSIIYSYFNTDAKRDVEVIKARVKYDKTRKLYDYWEPSRPLEKYGMEPMPDLDEDKELVGRSKTRWKQLRKKVVYLDFRAELSAYDKYMYFYEGRNTHIQGVKNKHVRTTSTHMKNAFDEMHKSHIYFKKERIIENVEIPKKVLDIAGEILGKQYSSAKLLTHRYLHNEGSSVLYTNGNINYSEAHAGSGEFSVLNLIYKIVNAEKYSLILLDEPEVSLFPAAQRKLFDFLLDEIIQNKHQIVISTHSPEFLKYLPSVAIKKFTQGNPERITVQNQTYWQDAFNEIGAVNDRKKYIYVEDRLAKQLIEFVVKKSHRIGEEHLANLEIVPVGGEKEIFQRIYAYVDDTDKYIILDGDCYKELTDPASIPETENYRLGELIKTITNVEIKNLSLIKIDDDSTNATMRNYLKFLHGYLNFLPSNIPEQIVWDNCNNDEIRSRYSEITGYKEKFKALAKDEYGEDEVNSETIFLEQKRILNKINMDLDDIKKIENLIIKILNLS